MSQQLLTALAALGILAAIVYLLIRNDVVRRTIVCPRQKSTCDVEVLRRGFSGEGKALRVKSCTLFAKPRRIECQQECLKSVSA